MFIPQKQSNKNDILEEQTELKDVDFNSKENKIKILRFLSLMPSSYVGEIAWETSISEYYIKNTLSIMEREELIERLIVNPDRPILLLMARVPDQSAIGQGGTANFSKKRWFAITEKGKKYLKEGG